ncbi:hypothetical protein [Chroococcidiopsis sp.]|uniref:hypothetical protein n=1 Tax=Chroococcidiopsis sp. TaxID=3088168 RepID=UPI003F3E45A8
MIKYELIDNVRRTITISLEASSPHERASIVVNGDESLKAIATDILSRSHGAFGHIIGEITSPIDLDSALHGSAFKDYRIELTQGKELVSSYDSGIPEGAVT